MKIPPMPPNWNKTISDLMDEFRKGKSIGIGSPEIDWAREYERRLLPKDIRFPKQGDIYEAIEDMKVSYLTAWAAPFTGGGEGELKKGEKIIVKHLPGEEQPIGVYAEAVDYKVLEERMVPIADRKEPKYGGFYFSFKTLVLNQKFKLISEASA